MRRDPHFKHYPDWEDPEYREGLAHFGDSANWITSPQRGAKVDKVKRAKPSKQRTVKRSRR